MSATKSRKQSSQANKRVFFQDDVVVHSFDNDDEKVVDNNNSRRTSPRIPSSNNAGSETAKTGSKHVDGSDHDVSFRLRKPPSSYSVPLVTEDINVVRFRLVRDRVHKQIFLQFSVPLGPSYGPKGVMVKANLHGTKIRVMACSKKPTMAPDGQEVKMEYNETFSLPVAVDPEKVTARVDNLGYLMIGAPVMRGI